MHGAQWEHMGDTWSTWGTHGAMGGGCTLVDSLCLEGNFRLRVGQARDSRESRGSRGSAGRTGSRGSGVSAGSGGRRDYWGLRMRIGIMLVGTVGV